MNNTCHNHLIAICCLLCLIALFECSNKVENAKMTPESELPKEITYKQSDYGDAWPFTVDEVTVYCSGYRRVYFRANGRVYPLNGKAIMDSKRNYNAIWRDNPKVSGIKIDVPSEFIANALKNCDDLD